MLWKTFLTFAAVFILGTSAFFAQTKPQTKLPDTPAGRRAAALQKVFETEDEASIIKFFDEHIAPGFRNAFPIEQHVAQFKRGQQTIGKSELLGFESPAPGAAMIMVKSVKSGKTFRIQFNLEMESPNRITALGWREVNDSPKPRLQFASFDELDKTLQKETAENRFSGVVFVGDGGKILFHKAYGWANKTNKIANRPDTKFNIGSLVKAFTEVAVLQLAEKETQLDDTIGKYLTGFPPQIADHVTIRHLLQHRSGWAQYWNNDEYRKNLQNMRSIDAYLKFIRKIPLEFEPGTREQYSNTGFIVLGGIIEKVSGQTYYDYLQKNIFDSLGMKNTGFPEIDMPVEDLAVGYTNQSPLGAVKGFERSNIFILPPKGASYGDGYSTAEDMLKFFNGLFADRLISRDYTDQIFRRFEKSNQPLDRSKLRAAPAGGAPGLSSVAIIGGNRPTVIVLSNYDQPLAEELGMLIDKALPQLTKNGN